MQSSFMRQKIRIVVATVAFGLGVDLSSISTVLHYDLPTSIEGYVQEIGRAGRDGASARCHTLLCSEDFVQHHSLAHSNALAPVQIRGLLLALKAQVCTNMPTLFTLIKLHTHTIDIS